MGRNKMFTNLKNKLLKLDELLKADKPKQETLEEFLARGGKKQTAAIGESGKPIKKPVDSNKEEDAADAFLRSVQQKAKDEKVDPDSILAQEKTGARKYDNWKPIGAKSEAEKEKFNHYKQRGFSDREAEQLAGIDTSHLHSHRKARLSTTKPSQPSQAMLDLIKPWALEQDSKYKSLERREAAPEKQPILHALGQREQAYKDHFDDYKKALQDFRGSDNYKGMKASEKLKAEHEFKKQYAANNAQKQQDMHSKIGQAEATRGQALDARAQELAGIRGEIASGGASMDTAPDSDENDIYDNVPSGDMSSQAIAESLTGRKQGEDTGSSGVSINKNPIAQFAQQHPEYAKYLNEKHKDRLNHIKAAKQQAMINTPTSTDTASESPATTQSRQPGQMDPEEQHRLNRIKELSTQKSKWTPEQQLASNHLVKDWLPFIQMHAFKLYGDKRIGKDDVEDMFEPGVHGLMQAIRDYDHEKATRFSSGQDQDKLFRKFAGPKVRGAMLKHVASQEVIPQHERVAAKKFEAQQKAQTPTAENTEPVQAPTTTPKVGE